jgi:hypothetical protein
MKRFILLGTIFISASVGLLPIAGFAQFRDTLQHADTLRTKIVPPTISEVVIQSFVGETVFGGVFFALKGNEILNGQSAKITTAYDPSISLLAWAASATAITIWGNTFFYGENNCWRPILGGLVGLFFGPLVDRISGGKLSATELGSYLVLSQFSIAGAIATYYLWPTDQEPTVIGSSSGFRLAPFISPLSSGIGVSRTIQ